ncbi:hypothetical protein L1887_56961 [Cichorium endivia]|nr:hypothetical protein L1887_56961 [Cichorium endivia]
MFEAWKATDICRATGLKTDSVLYRSDRPLKRCSIRKPRLTSKDLVIPELTRASSCVARDGADRFIPKSTGGTGTARERESGRVPSESIVTCRVKVGTMLLKAATPFDDHLLEVWLVSDAMQGRVRIVEYSQSGIGEEAAVGGGWEHRIMSSDPASTDVHGAMLGHVLRCVPFWMISTVLREGDDGEQREGGRANGKDLARGLARVLGGTRELSQPQHRCHSLRCARFENLWETSAEL